MVSTPPAMRLIVATVEDYDAPPLLRALTGRGWGVTQIAATGGALRGGRVTLLIGVSTGALRSALRLIEEYCRETLDAAPEPTDVADEAWYPPSPVDALTGGALVLVLPVVRFERL